MKVIAIGSDLFVTGMRFSGVPGKEIQTQEELSALLDELASKNEYGILFIGATLATQSRQVIDDFKLRKPLPIILEVPDGKTERPSDYLATFLNQSLGVNV